MNPVGLAEAKKIGADVKKGLRGLKKTEVVLCPPFVYLPVLASAVGGVVSATLMLGAQDASPETSGAYTGEVGYAQLPDFKVSMVIIGHSERRARGETDEMVNKKVRAVVGEGMTAIVCVGEAKRDHNGDYLAFIRGQLLSALKDVSRKSLDHVVVAYEPVWAIGAKYAMTPRDVHETAIFIRKILSDAYGALADGVRILYGGSVDVVNAAEIVREGNVSGLLVGRESLKPKNFVQIVKDIEAI